MQHYVEKILFLVFFWELPQRIFDKRIFCFKIRICLAKTIFLIDKMLFFIIIFAFNTMVLNPLQKSQKNSKKNFFDRLSRYKIPLFGPQKKMKNFSKTFSTWCNRQKTKKKHRLHQVLKTGFSGIVKRIYTARPRKHAPLNKKKYIIKYY